MAIDSRKVYFIALQKINLLVVTRLRRQPAYVPFCLLYMTLHLPVDQLGVVAAAAFLPLQPPTAGLVRAKRWLVQFMHVLGPVRVEYLYWCIIRIQL